MKTIKINCTASHFCEPDKIIEFQGKLKELDELNYLKLRDAILEDGFISPFHIWKEKGKCLDGHQRLKALKRMRDQENFEIPKLPATLISAQSVKEAKRKLLRLTSQYGIMQEDGLKLFVEDDFTLDEMQENFRFPEIDLDSFSLENPNPEQDEKENDIPETPKVPVSRLGDLILLGRHKLLCGDCAIKENVDKLMQDEKADMVFTDPPYGINLDTDYSVMKNSFDCVFSKGGKKHKKVLNDDKDFIGKFILDFFDYCKEIFLWGADYYIETLERTHANLGSWIVWDKRSNEEMEIEKALSSDRVFGFGFELCWSKEKHKREIARIRSGIFGVSNEQGTKKTVHPTQKPIQPAEWFLNKYSKENNLIIDIFLGSGSTLIACEKTNRKCYGMEIDPHYCDVIIKRWCDYTGNNKIIRNEKHETIKLNEKENQEENEY